MRSAKDFTSWRGSQPALPGPVEPERAAGLRGEMPGDDLAHVGVELVLGGLDVRRGRELILLFSAPRRRSAQRRLPVARPDRLTRSFASGNTSSMVAWLGGRVTSEPTIMQSAEPKTIGTTVMNPFQKLTSPRGLRKSTLIASLPWPICQMTSPGVAGVLQHGEIDQAGGDQERRGQGALFGAALPEQGGDHHRRHARRSRRRRSARRFRRCLAWL